MRFKVRSTFQFYINNIFLILIIECEVKAIIALEQSVHGPIHKTVGRT